MFPAAPVQPIPITAYAACTALGTGLANTIEGVLSGRSGLRAPDVELPFTTLCGVVADLPPLGDSLVAFDSRAARIVHRLLDDVAGAVESAVRRHGADRVGVFLGTSVGGLEQTEAALRIHRATGALPDDYDLRRKHSLHAVVDLTRARFGLRGPGYTVSTACSSSGKVFACAQRLLRLGVIDAAIVGGVDALCRTTLYGFHSLGILSARACRPFGLGRDGLNLGEGGAVFVLEREGDGRAMLLGVGEGSDGYHMSSPDPEGHGSRAAMLGALAQAGLDAAVVDHINAHGTGTPQNDAVESRVVAEVFGRDVPTVSTKGATGHCLGAAGAIEAAIALASLEEGRIPPSLGSSPLDPGVGIHINLAPASLRCRVVLSNSFGFGGSNVSLLLGAA